MKTQIPIEVSSPPAVPDFVFVIDLRGASAGVEYRPWAEYLLDCSLLRWCCDRLSPVVPSLALLCDSADKALIASETAFVKEMVHVIPIAAETTPCDAYRAALKQTSARYVIATVLAAAVLPPAIWKRVARRHIALRSHVTWLSGLPAGGWAHMFDAAVLDALDQLVPDHLWIDPNHTLRSIVLSSGSCKTPVPDQFAGGYYEVPDDPEVRHGQMPDRLTLETPSDVESLRLALSANISSAPCLLARLCEVRREVCEKALQSLFPFRGGRPVGGEGPRRIMYASIASGFSGA